ncbi:ABC transporter permease [Bosea sp. (in: a-proteobacteria)]|uniref:ABC transporter permease n=1 Tax=Bosea sp. (in: a-proteobacteria) TaxID=1871050 RepID=UPI002DDC9884|nr:ABC transporter permease [Bosea sp. (in: a-proteobacteria)]HEV2510844.1 ABC transporter permease [Bosea sp. (in: a-proteobacteria)]
MSNPAMLVHDARLRRRHPWRSALIDLASAVRLAELWLTMGWYDVRQRYSRSVFGPFWLTISLAVFVAGLGITYAALFRVPVATYLPYVTVGMVLWSLVTALLNEGAATFTAATAAIKQMPAPIGIHVLRVVWRNLIILAHNAVIVLAVLAACGIKPGWAGFAALPGLAIVLINGIGWSVSLGLVGARFRDMMPLVANATQMLLFVTPVLWRAEDLGQRQALAEFNPLFHLIEIVRAPLLGAGVPMASLAVALAFTVFNLGVALALYARLRWRVAYWL